MPVTPNIMARAWHKGMSDDTMVIEAFRQFAELVDFTSIYNYDPYDIFYWEHRMGTWHSLVLLESDVAFDTFIPFNCRVLTEKILSVSMGQRLESSAYYKVIKRLWPVLLQWPINQLPLRLQMENLQTEYDNLSKEINRLKGKEAFKVELENEEALQSVVKNSFAFRLGTIIVKAVSNPGKNTLLLPYRLLLICMERLRKRNTQKHKCTK